MLPSPTVGAAVPSTTVAIIGSGFGGLCMAIALGRAGLGDSFLLLEKAGSVGGTWRDNTYPGAACDVPSHLYSFSFEIKHDWSRAYAEQPEILAYLEHCARKYDVLPRVRFRVEVESATWDEAASLWRIRTTDGEEVTAGVLVSACGQLNRPAYPRVPGRERFAGAQFHSARWDHGYDLRGRRVAVVGTGASAIQFVPHVVERASHVTLLQRTPPWVFPKPDRAYRPVEKELFRRVPPLQALSRLAIYCTNELRFLGFRKDSPLEGLYRKLGVRQMRRDVGDEKLRAQLVPDYPIGCKRVLISNDYYPALARPHVEVVTGELVEIQPDCVVTTGGRRHEVDAIIYGTGFQTSDFLAPMRIVGRGGVELNQAWRDGAEAYLGLTVTGFPNLFLLYGPNTNLGHNSIIYMLESQVRYVMACLRALRDGNLRSMDVKPERLRAYSGEMQARLKGLVWDAGCTSWYKTASGRQPNNWPGHTFEYRRRTSRVDLADYEVDRR